METVNLTLDEDLIRFTPEGKIAVIDAIKALTGTDDGNGLWQTIIDDNPELSASCDTYRFPKSESTPVAGRKAWEKVEALLFDYLMTMDIESTAERMDRDNTAQAEDT